MPRVNNPREADLLVDVANVVLCGDFGPDPIGRLNHALSVWTEAAGLPQTPGANAYLVCDNSLLPPDSPLPGAAAGVLKDWHNRGELVAVPHADPVLLELSALLDRPVMSRDRFIDQRRSSPWIQGNTNDFHWPVLDDARQWGIEVRDMGVVPDNEVSRGIEEAEQTRLRANPDRRRNEAAAIRQVLARQWECGNNACLRNAYGITIPRINNQGTAVCPACGRNLGDVGPFVPRVEIVVNGPRESTVRPMRVTLVEGKTLGFGRAADVNIGGLVAPDEGNLISRTHIELWLDGDTVRARDVSQNGVEVTRRNEIPHPMRPNQWQQLQNDQLRLPGNVVIRRSGQRRAAIKFTPSGLSDQTDTAETTIQTPSESTPSGPSDQPDTTTTQ